MSLSPCDIMTFVVRLSAPRAVACARPHRALVNRPAASRRHSAPGSPARAAHTLNTVAERERVREIEKGGGIGIKYGVVGI